MRPVLRLLRLARTPRTLNVRALHTPPPRAYAESSGAQQHRPHRSAIDETISGIADQYAIAKDEFETAYESTRNNTIYAREDRESALAEVRRLEELYQAAVQAEEGVDGDEVRRRLGQRIREIRTAVERLCEEAEKGEH